MSLLLKAFPHGRPTSRARTQPRLVLAPVLVSVLALVAVLLPLAGAAEAQRPGRAAAAAPRSHQAQQHRRRRPGRQQAEAASRSAQAAARPWASRRAATWSRPTSYFSFPNRSKAERRGDPQAGCCSASRAPGAVGGPGIGTPLPTNGTIRIATWSFDDWDIAKALVAARKRGVSVQVVAAKAANKDHPAWHWLRERLGQRLYRPGRPTTRETRSASPASAGAPAAVRAAPPHAKYFLFDNVGPQHSPHGDLPDLVEPDLHGLPGAVEPGAGHRTPPRSTTTS